MGTVVRIARMIAPAVEFLGAVLALVAGIVANGNLQTRDGRIAVVLAIVAGVGHAVNHTTEGIPSEAPAP